MNALTRADGKMMMAFGTNLEILVQLLVENHRRAFRAFGPQPLRDVAFARFGIGGTNLRFLGKRGPNVGWRWRDRRFDGGFNTERFFGKHGGCHGLKL